MKMLWLYLYIYGFCSNAVGNCLLKCLFHFMQLFHILVMYQCFVVSFKSFFKLYNWIWGSFGVGLKLRISFKFPFHKLSTFIPWSRINVATTWRAICCVIVLRSFGPFIRHASIVTCKDNDCIICQFLFSIASTNDPTDHIHFKKE